MAATLRNAFDSIVVLSSGDRPWQASHDGKSKTTSNNVRCASAILFTEDRLQLTSGLSSKAVLILQHAYQNGRWPTWTHAPRPSIETTAMAMHALAMVRPRGWEEMLAQAKLWLLDSQNEQGYWTERGAPDPVYLTVLVMDALELATQSSTQLTFRLSSTPPGKKSNKNGFHSSLSPTQWQDIEIRFTSDLMVQMFCGEASEVCKYDELGFEDRRTTNPNQAWTTLCTFAQHEGAISCVGGTKEWSRLEKDVQKIRKILSGYFGLAEDPIPYVRAAHSYRPRFKITLAPSFGVDYPTNFLPSR